MRQEDLGVFAKNGWLTIRAKAFVTAPPQTDFNLIFRELQNLVKQVSDAFPKANYWGIDKSSDYIDKSARMYVGLTYSAPIELMIRYINAHNAGVKMLAAIHQLKTPTTSYEILISVDGAEAPLIAKIGL